MDSNTYSVPFVYPVKNDLASPLRIQVPGSKSITNRALLLAALAEGTSVLRGVLFSEDSRHFLCCIQKLGFSTEVNEADKIIRVKGMGGLLPNKEAHLYVGSAGTAARFLAAWLGVSQGIYHMDASEQMRARPMAPLLASLKDLGCDISFADRDGYFPFTLHGHGFAKDAITVDISHSSQFLSALLITCCLSDRTFTVQTEGTHGMSYIHITREMMGRFGVTVQQPASDRFVVEHGQRYHSLDYQIEPDVSAACYFYAMALLLGIPVLVSHIELYSLQGDIRFLRILEQMGCFLKPTPEGVLLSPPVNGSYEGIDVNMSDCSDQAITLAALAPFADTPTTIRGIGHIRHQECDRMNAIVTELGKIGILCRETEDSITIYPGQPKPAVINTYDDHRVAMGFSLIGLRSPGIVIDNPGCCRKTFENYFEVLEEAVTVMTCKID